MAEFAHPVNVLEVLENFPFPATVPELVAYAEDNDASSEVLDIIRAMPEREYDNIQDINRQLNRLDIEDGEENLYSSNAEDEIRHAPHATDDANISREGHRLGNWVRT